MIAPFIYSNSVKKNIEYFEESSIKYLICSILYNNPLSLSRVEERINGFLEIKLNKSQFIKYMEKNFVLHNDFYYLTEIEKNAIKLTDSFKEQLLLIKTDTSLEYFLDRINLINIQKYDFIESLQNAIIINKIKSSETNFYHLALFFDLVYNEKEYLEKFRIALSLVDPFFNQISLSIVFQNKNIIELFHENGLFLVEDLKSHFHKNLFLLISCDFNNSLFSIQELQFRTTSHLEENLIRIFSELDDREFKVLSKRNYFEDQKFTLEEIATEYGLTRERCRQIEANAINKLIGKIRKVRVQTLSVFFALSKQNDFMYVSIELLERYFSKKDVANYYLLILKLLEESIELKYIREFSIIINTKLTSLNQLTKKAIEGLGFKVHKSKLLKFSSFEKSVINKYYYIYSNDFFIRKGFSTKELVGLLIDEIFPQGYRIGNKDDYNLLKNTFYDNYKSNEFPSDRSIVGFLDRLDYCLVDRGKYQNRILCAKLSKDLLQRIINFVISGKPVVYYQSIYENFKNELSEINVNNYFFLKGLIDPYFPKDFQTKRNYVLYHDSKLTGLQSIGKFIENTSGTFSINDLQNQFIGVKDYTFYNLLSQESEKGLIWLANKKFIYLHNINIPEKCKSELKVFIDNMFILVNSETISSRKIFARLSLTNKALLESLKIVTDNFSMFSLIKYWFNNFYSFNRPLISRSTDVKINTYSLITNYVNTLDYFSLITIKDYVLKMNIGGLYSYLEFMDDMSDNYVQINIDSMVKKETFNQNEIYINEIRSTLRYFYKRFNSIDTRKFSGYEILPKLSYPWNKYLLVGVIRSYLADEFVIEYTEKAYDSTQFIIKRRIL